MPNVRFVRVCLFAGHKTVNKDALDGNSQRNLNVTVEFAYWHYNSWKVCESEC